MAMSLAQVRTHDKDGDFWVVINGYVVDISNFISHHPGSMEKIKLKRKQVGPDVTSNFVDHFRHTVSVFRNACKRYDNMPKGQGICFEFEETPGVQLKIIGKVSY